MTAQNIRVIVVGGGYAGVMAANRLRSRDDLHVTLVNPRPQFVERIRLHQLAADAGGTAGRAKRRGTSTAGRAKRRGTSTAGRAKRRGTSSAVAEFGAVLNPGVQLVVDNVERIDAPVRRLALSSGTSLDYDYLVYAVGSTGAVPDGVPGAAEFAYPLAELEQAQRLRSRLADVAAIAPVVVIGGGLTGIEAAAEFAEAGRDVTLVSPVVGPSLSGPGRRSVTRRLRKLGVHLVSASVRAVGADHVVLDDARSLPSAVTVWTAGFGVPTLAADSGLATDPLGRLLTDETLTSVDDDRIVAAGDSAAPSGLPYRMSCQAGLPLGAQAAETVLARIAGTDAAVATVPMSGQCISLGRDAGTVQLQRKDDTPLNLYLGGRTGAFVKEQVCRFTITWLAAEARKPGSYRSLKGPDRSELIASTAVPVR
ncbi:MULTISPECIES: NAD(P)/FAD-dependent oxidoreductase [Mycolicibacterium]|uniref:FAD-dependent pyridine nucleotide-disulfide oxidoreductase n=1 Tax=Mycolicibacterium gilvum (strain PYR-GCK) TaxID=350054 RepID=A4T6P6_MYCGI|nr:FAD-dependent oxidoreductase [Mycolicibacterium sp. PAM1]ABP44408.1 FAD-dependent pyridine nucleotide-disulfide oxidoreductase [Mycolicibacterium gilvum PYR-GCK]MBV5244241.1 FAD-dependent oxidoreductase [Mycolicibacterium sp. PAM1]